MQCRNAVLLRCSWPIPVLMISVWGGRWKSWAQAASHPGLGLRKVWDEQLVICVPAETSTVLEQTRSLLTGWAGDDAAAGVLCPGHVTRDTCDGCWRGLAASSRCGHQTPTQNHWPRHPPPNSALPRAFQHFTSGLLWRQKYLHDKKNIRLSVEQYCQTCTDQYFCNFLFKLWICFHPAASSIQQL